MTVRLCTVCARPTTSRRSSRCALHPVQQQRRPERGTATYRNVRLQVLDRDGHVCRWCGQPATHVDHYPIAYRDGGPSTPDNLVASCVACNCSGDARLTLSPRATS